MKERLLISRILTLALVATAPFSLRAQPIFFSSPDCSLSADGLVRSLNGCVNGGKGPHQGRGECSVVLLDLQRTLGQRVFHFQVNSADQKTTDFTFRADEPLAVVASRDVNRDGAFDLVVEQSLTHKLLQVWLNDGHGNFRQARASRFHPAGREPPHHIGTSRSGKGIPRHRSSVKRGSKLILDRVLASSKHSFSIPEHSFLFESADERERRGPNPSRAPPASFFS